VKPSTCRYCDSTQNELRKRTLTNGSVQYVFQCLHCGAALTQAIRKAEIRQPERLRAFDESLIELYREMQQRERLDQREDWFRQHNAYLRTPEWRARRAAVLKRAHGVCEGCGVADATQVHHLTYEHWQQEFLWELVAVCDGCHERLHEHMQRKP
jgi:5-methylcytosine-specific restriction endonuclease McrA